MLVLVSTYALDLAYNFVRTPKPGWGRLDGSRALVTDRFERAVLEYLKQRPGGTVLQHVEAEAFTAGPGLTTLAGRKAFLGWPSHEKLWRARNPEVERRRRRMELFYAGDFAASAEWLIENRIDDVLWLKNDNKAPAGTFEKIQGQIEQHYYWREFYSADPFRVGVWSRRRQ